MGRALLVCAAVAALATFGCSSSSGSGPSSAGVQIAPDLAMPRGVRLVGRMVPDLQDAVVPAGASDRPGRLAYLQLRRSAQAVWTDLVASAARANYSGLASASQACTSSADPGPDGAGGREGGTVTTCSGQGSRPDGSEIDVALASCHGCAKDFRLGRVRSADAQTAVRPRVRSLSVHQAEGPSDPLRWARIPETAVAQQGWYYACQQNQQVDLTVSGSPDAAWQAALDNMLPVSRAAAISDRGSEVREAFGADGSDTQVLVLDMGATPDPVLHVWGCEG
jgi:hypothetical protein